MKQFGKVYIIENVHDYLATMVEDFENIIKCKDSIIYETADKTYIHPNEQTNIGSSQGLWDRQDLMNEWEDTKKELLCEFGKLVEEKMNRIDEVMKKVILSPNESRSSKISALVQIDDHKGFQPGKKHPALIEQRNSQFLRCFVVSDDFELYIFHLYQSEVNQKNPPIYFNDEPIGMVVMWNATTAGKQ